MIFYDAALGGGVAKSYVVFEPAQIKSATGNSGAFDGANPDIRYSIKQGADPAPEQRQFADTEKAIGGKPAYEQAKAAGKTKLNYGQWVQVRTPNFKAWFGDWEAVRGVKQLNQVKPLVLDGVAPLDGKKAIEEAFSNFAPVANANDGRVITFPNSMAGKVARHKGFDVGRIAGAFDQLLQSAVPMMSQTEQAREGHKAHPEITAYHHYINRFEQGGNTYYARFTVQQMKTKPGKQGANYAHSTFVSSVEVYENKKGAEPVAVGGWDNPVLTASESAPTDKILAQWLEDGKSASEITDPETGEPMVVYHGTAQCGFDIFSRQAWRAADGQFFTLRRRQAIHYYFEHSPKHR